MPSGRRSVKEMDEARKAIADIITYHKDKIHFINGKPSPLSIAKLVKELYSIEVTRQFAYKVISEGEYGKFVDTLCLEDNPKIIELKDAMATQQKLWKDENVSPKERTMAANSWRAIQKQLTDYERDVADIKIKETEASRPIYLIKFIPPSVVTTCPKCNHTFYDVRSEKEVIATSKELKRVEDEKKMRGEDWKPFYTKDCKEQTIFDDFEEKNDEKIKEKNKKTGILDGVEVTSVEQEVFEPSD